MENKPVPYRGDAEKFWETVRRSSELTPDFKIKTLPPLKYRPTLFNCQKPPQNSLAKVCVDKNVIFEKLRILHLRAMEEAQAYGLLKEFHDLHMSAMKNEGLL